MTTKGPSKEQVLSEIQEMLKASQCEAEVQTTDIDGILFGKLVLNDVEYRIVTHIIRNDVRVATSNSGAFDNAKADELNRTASSAPNLDSRASRSTLTPKSELEKEG